MKHRREDIYMPPAIEINEVAIEQGFTVSGYANDSDDSEFGGPYYY